VSLHRTSGCSGYVVGSCETFGAVLERYVRYERLFYDTRAGCLREEDGVVRLEWDTPHGVTGPLVDECALAALTQFARDLVSRPVALASVEFVNPKPKQMEPYRTFFGCPVHFGAAVTSLCFERAALDVPLLRPDPLLLEVLDRQADSILAEREGPNDFAASARRAIARALRDGDPTVERAAESLHMSTRTFHRRLEAEGETFRALLDDCRKEVAMRRLRGEPVSIAELGQDLGYSDQSAFGRAFRRWTGVSPTDWRRADARRS